MQTVVGKGKDFNWFWDKLESYLKAQDLKQTKQRKVIIEHFLNLDTHVDADNLHSAIRDSGHNIGLATIYRTLNLLMEAGLIEQQSFADGRAVFEVDRPGTHHDHLVCLDCGHVIEFENDQVEKIQQDIAEKYGFELRSHRHDLFGSCLKKECPRKN